MKRKKLILKNKVMMIITINQTNLSTEVDGQI